MPDPVNDIEDKLEGALTAVLSDAGIEDLAALYTGVNFTEKEDQYVVVSVLGGPEEPIDSGNYTLQVEITAYVAGDVEADEQAQEDPRAKISALSQAVRNAILVDDIPALLTAAEEDFTCIRVFNEGPDRGFDGRSHWRKLKLKIFCAGVDFPD
jgi:hypothetical protein